MYQNHKIRISSTHIVKLDENKTYGVFNVKLNNNYLAFIVVFFSLFKYN